MKKQLVGAAVGVALLGGVLASHAGAESGGSGNAQCQVGGNTSNSPPGWQANGVPEGFYVAVANGGGSNPQAAWLRC